MPSRTVEPVSLHVVHGSALRGVEAHSTPPYAPLSSRVDNPHSPAAICSCMPNLFSCSICAGRFHPSDRRKCSASPSGQKRRQAEALRPGTDQITRGLWDQIEEPSAQRVEL